MGDVLDIKRIMYALSSNQDHVSEFLHFSDPNHQIDVHARKLLMLIAADDERDRLSVDQESGYAGHASLQELGFRVGASVRETVVLGHLANIGAKRRLARPIHDLPATNDQIEALSGGVAARQEVGQQ